MFNLNTQKPRGVFKYFGHLQVVQSKNNIELDLMSPNDCFGIHFQHFHFKHHKQWLHRDAYFHTACGDCIWS